MYALKSFLLRQPRLALALHMIRQAMRPPRHDMVLTPQGFRIAGNLAMQAGVFEPAETALIEKLLPEHDRFIDCGANIGFFSCLARKYNKPVLAVEPLVSNLMLLMANLSENGWRDTEIAPVGLGRHIGIAEIFGSDTGASLVPGWATMPCNTPLRERIALTTLDTLVADRFPGERFLIKVDVEGGEFDLLKGAGRTLARWPSPTWIVEICLSENFPAGANPHFVDTFDLLFSHGYRAYAAKNIQHALSREQILTWVRAGQAERGGYNYVFRRVDSPA